MALMRALLEMWCVCREQVSGCFKSPPFRAVAIIHEQLSPPFRIFHLPCFLALMVLFGETEEPLKNLSFHVFAGTGSDMKEADKRVDGIVKGVDNRELNGSRD